MLAFELFSVHMRVTPKSTLLHIITTERRDSLGWTVMVISEGGGRHARSGQTRHEVLCESNHKMTQNPFHLSFK